MLKVSKCERRPNHCALTGRSQDPHGFIDTGITLPGFEPRIYLSAAGVRQAMSVLGFPDPFAYADLQDKHAAAEERIAQLEAENAGMAEQLEAIAVLRRYGTKTEKKPGRPAKAAA